MSNKDKHKSIIRNANIIIIVSIILCFLAPIILTQPFFSELFNYSETGQIGDTIGGITAPFVNLVGSILVFYALKAQIDANKLIQEQFNDQKQDEIQRKKLLYITEQVNIIRNDINEFTFSYKKDNYKYNYTSSDAIFQFLNSIKKGGGHEIIYEDFLNENPKIFELITLLKIFKNQIEIINKENISELDKKYFLSLLDYQHKSKIIHPICAFEKYNRDIQKECSGCKQKHGIPSTIFSYNDEITKLLN